MIFHVHKIINIPSMIKRNERSSFLLLIQQSNITDLHLNRWRKNRFKLNWLCCTFYYNAKHLEHIHQSFLTSSAFAQKSSRILLRSYNILKIKMYNITFTKWYEIYFAINVSNIPICRLLFISHIFKCLHMFHSKHQGSKYVFGHIKS